MQPGSITGGQASATGGLLQRRREVLHLEAQTRLADGGASKKGSSDGNDCWRRDRSCVSRAGNSWSRYVTLKCRGSHCGKTKPDSSMCWEI